MSRPTTTLLIAVLAALPVTPAMADLNELLGKWMDAASGPSGKRAPLEFRAEADSASQQGHQTRSQPSTLTADEDPGLMELAEPAPSTRFAPAELEPAPQQSWSADESHQAFQPPVISENPYVKSQHGSYQASGVGSGYSGCSACSDGSCDGAGCKCQHGRCEFGCGAMLGPGDVCHLGLSECRPHHPPTLPPPSSFLQYFRSRNSYSDVWAGYADETRHRWRNRSPYLHGTWMNPGCQGCGQILEPRGHGGCQCESCDAH